MIGRVGALALAVTLAVAGCAQPGSAPAADPASASGDVLTSLVAADGPGCSAAVGRRGEVVWAGARGLADVDAEVALTEATAFDLASVSKQFTAIAVVRLVQDGVLALDDPLAEHLSGLPAWAATVTLDDLLHHTSGIPDYTTLLTDAGTTPADPADQADALDAIRSVTEPGPRGRFAYSNSNYVLLAEVVAAATAGELGAVLADRVFGAHDLRLTPAAEGDGVAVPYTRSGAGWRPTRSAWTQVGDGSVVTSPSALVAWADVYRTDDALRAALTDGAVETGSPDGSRYGRGLVVAHDGSLSHAGGWAGYTSLFGVTGDGETVIAVSCNALEAPAGPVAEGLREIWADGAQAARDD